MRNHNDYPEFKRKPRNVPLKSLRSGSSGKVRRMYTIHRVQPEYLRIVIITRFPRGLFLARKGFKWIAIDNITGDAWTEEFRWKRTANKWLRGLIDSPEE